MEKDYKEFIQKAINARENAYVPYSNFAVGAVIRTKNGKDFIGCNVENASYGACNCAERTAIFKAVSEGYTEFSMIAIVGGAVGSNEINDYAYPCGICRQVMEEFCDEDFEIIVAKSINDYKVFKLTDLLPNSFGKNNL